MNKFKAMILGVSILGISSLTSCKKEGCTDADASNFSSEAKKDDGSCTYSGKVQFWYGQVTSQNLSDDYIQNLTYYIDNTIIGSSAASVYFTGSPSCGQTSVVGKTMDLGATKSKTSSYKVVDENGDNIWSGTVQFDASQSCTSYELTY